MTNTLTTTSTITSTPTSTTTDTGVDRDRTVSTLVAAFSTDPLIRWLYPDPHQYVRCFPRLVDLLGGDAFGSGTAAVSADYTGAALWVAPDVVADDEAVGELFAESIDARRFDAVVGLLEQVVAHHPTEPVWYLPFIGVDPLVQGRGVGSGLLAAGLARADRDALSPPTSRPARRGTGRCTSGTVSPSSASSAPPTRRRCGRCSARRERTTDDERRHRRAGQPGPRLPDVLRASHLRTAGRPRARSGPTPGRRPGPGHGVWHRDPHAPTGRIRRTRRRGSSAST